MFRGKLSAMVVSAVNHLFLNDVWIDNTLDMRRIMVRSLHLGRPPLTPGLSDTVDCLAQSCRLQSVWTAREARHQWNGNSERGPESRESQDGYRHGVSPLASSAQGTGRRSLQSKQTRCSRNWLMVCGQQSIVARSEAVMAAAYGEEMYTRLKYYVDSEILLKEFSMAADMLSLAWIGNLCLHFPVFSSAWH